MVDVKMNFKKLYLDTACNFCNQDESQSHLMECKSIIENCHELYNDIETEYEHIYKSTAYQLKIVKLYVKIMKTREKLLYM